MNIRHSLAELWKVVGPIILSALSLFVTFKILEPVALSLGKNFDLLANKGVGKIAFSVMVLLQIVLFLSIYSKKLVDKILNYSIYMFTEKKCFLRCGRYFSFFAIFHIIAQFFFYLSGFSYYNKTQNITFAAIFSLPKGLLFSFFIVFLLAWSEEVIFRGMLYSYFAQFYQPFSSIIITSLIFMFAHDLSNPLNLITKNWQLGLGLFFLGILLNLIFVLTGKLYTGIGAHMGLVAVKVFLRRIPLVEFIPEDQLPFWINNDLRESLVIQALFLIVIILLVIRHNKRLFPTTPNKIPANSNIQ